MCTWVRGAVFRLGLAEVNSCLQATSSMALSVCRCRCLPISRLRQHPRTLSYSIWRRARIGSTTYDRRACAGKRPPVRTDNDIMRADVAKPAWRIEEERGRARFELACRPRTRRLASHRSAEAQKHRSTEAPTRHSKTAGENNSPQYTVRSTTRYELHYKEPGERRSSAAGDSSDGVRLTPKADVVIRQHEHAIQRPQQR